MFSWTSVLYSGSLVLKVSVCGMPVVFPVAALFSKTIVAGPATAVSGEADVLGDVVAGRPGEHLCGSGLFGPVRACPGRRRARLQSEYQQQARQQGGPHSSFACHCVPLASRPAAGVGPPPL